MEQIYYFMREGWDRISRGYGVPPIVRAVTADALSYLGRVALTELHRQVEETERQGISGAIIEAGCALGGSAIVIVAAKSPARQMFVYDVFGMIPPPSPKDGVDVHTRYETILAGKAQGKGNKPYYGYQENLYAVVKSNFIRYGFTPSEHNVHLIQGLFQETLHVNQPVALAHIDGDWYESVTVCLERLEPCLVSGGRLIIDDYYHWSGCRMAVDEYFQNKRQHYHFYRRSRLHIVRH